MFFFCELNQQNLLTVVTVIEKKGKGSLETWMCVEINDQTDIFGTEFALKHTAET